MPTLYNWTFITNLNRQSTKDYCLRCGASVEKQGFKYVREHTWFCRWFYCLLVYLIVYFYQKGVGVWQFSKSNSEVTSGIW